jgi:hypothetical protein
MDTVFIIRQKHVRGQQRAQCAFIYIYIYIYILVITVSGFIPGGSGPTMSHNTE